MKKCLFFLVCSILFLASCGEDNDDIVVDDDVSNIDLDIGITFGEVKANCSLGCVRAYKWSKKGVFSADNSSSTFDNPYNYTFFDCPISEKSRFVSQANGIQYVPRGLRDIPSTNLSDFLSNNNSFPVAYIIEYTLMSGDTKTIQFFSASHSSEQINIYYDTVIDVINALDDLNTSPVDCN